MLWEYRGVIQILNVIRIVSLTMTRKHRQEVPSAGALFVQLVSSAVTASTIVNSSITFDSGTRAGQNRKKTDKLMKPVCTVSKAWFSLPVWMAALSNTRTYQASRKPICCLYRHECSSEVGHRLSRMEWLPFAMVHCDHCEGALVNWNSCDRFTR